MALPQPPGGEAQVTRRFEQPEDALSCYSDFAQIISTGQEVVLQFYETVPGSPELSGQIKTAKSRLRATITVSKAHAANIGRLLLKHTVEEGDGRS